MLVTKTNIYLPERTHVSCSLSSRRKNTNPATVSVCCWFIIQCCPGKLGKKGSERAFWVTVSLGQQLPLLCVCAVGPFFLTCNFHNTHKVNHFQSKPMTSRSIDKLQNLLLSFLTPLRILNATVSWAKVSIDYHITKQCFLVTDSRSSCKLTHQYLYQKLSLTHSRNLPGCLHHSALPFIQMSGHCESPSGPRVCDPETFVSCLKEISVTSAVPHSSGTDNR